jgi:hypothetical protein
MTDQPTDLREIAADLMIDHARDVEFGTVAEHLADDERYSDLPDDERDALARAIHDLIAESDITVSFPESETR